MTLPIRSALLALALMGPAAAAANAQSAAPASPPAVTPAQAQALRTACETDVAKLCAGIQPGGGRLVMCLREKQEQVSPPCKASLGALAAALRKPPQ